MKPLLLIPPATARWAAVEALLDNWEPARLEDIQRRLLERLENASDAFALVPSGGQALALACIRRRGAIGVLGEVFTREDHRKRGLCRSLLQTLLSWFDMTGGRWLYLTCPAELREVFGNFGFDLLHASIGGAARVTMLRKLGSAAASPYESQAGELAIRPAGRAEWPAIVALLQHRRGADARVPLAESALIAETTAFDLVAAAERGTGALLGAWRGPTLVGVGTVATDQLGTRSYGMMLPNLEAPAELREALVELGRTRGYERLDFPLEALAAAAT